MQVKIYRPAGNDTALIAAKPQRQNELNAAIMKMYPNVEQVGFVWSDENGKHLQMAGGETCLNALRSAAKYFCDELKQNNLIINMCGAKFKIWQKGDELFTQVDDTTSTLRICSDNEIMLLQNLNLKTNSAAIVNLGEISHICCLIQPEIFNSLSSDENALKNLGFKILEALKLSDKPACGLMLLTEISHIYKLSPVVYVKNLQTLFYESACGSGSLASFLFLRQITTLNEIKLLQPSGEYIKITADETSCTLSSKVQLLKEFEIC